MFQALTATADVLHAEEAQTIDTAYRRLTAANLEMQRLQRELDGLYERERRKARDDGREAGILLGLQVLADIDAATRSFFRSVEQDIALLSIAVAERVVGQLDEPDQVLRAARQAVRELSAEDAATLYVSTAHYSGLVTRLKDMQGTAAACTVQADPGLEASDCRLETARGVIDASITRQFDTLRQSIQAWRGAENATDAEQG